MRRNWNFDTDAIRKMAAEGMTKPEIARKLFPGQEIWTTHKKRGYCLPYERLVKHMSFHGISTAQTPPYDRRGEKNPCWRGGKPRYQKGYRLLWCPGHPNAWNGRMAEHRLVMERKLGRLLLREEVVHHVNGDTLDNRPENLELFSSNADHLRHELMGRVPDWTPEGKERMSQAVRRKRRSKLGVFESQ